MNSKSTDRFTYEKINGIKTEHRRFKSILPGSPQGIYPDGSVCREEAERLFEIWMQEGYNPNGSYRLVPVSNSLTNKIQPPVQAESSTEMKMNIDRSKLIEAIQANIDAKQAKFDADLETFETWSNNLKFLADKTTLSEAGKETAIDNALKAFSILKPIFPQAAANEAKLQITKLKLSTDTTIELEPTDSFMHYIQ